MVNKGPAGGRQSRAFVFMSSHKGDEESGHHLLPSYGLFPVTALLGVFLSTSLTTCLVKIRVMRAVEG